MLRDLGISPICEGIESVAEYDVLRDLGVTLMQGYLLAKPSLAQLAIPDWPRERELAVQDNLSDDVNRTHWVG
jgi:EAL domain-containing protein (putative c-di-GMP-specific phosphodiesterase class I)